MTFEEYKELRKSVGYQDEPTQEESWEQGQFWCDDEWISEIIEQFPILGNPDDILGDDFVNDTSKPFSQRWPRLIKLMLEQHYKIKI